MSGFCVLILLLSSSLATNISLRTSCLSCRWLIGWISNIQVLSVIWFMIILLLLMLSRHPVWEVGCFPCKVDIGVEESQEAKSQMHHQNNNYLFHISGCNSAVKALHKYAVYGSDVAVIVHPRPMVSRINSPTYEVGDKCSSRSLLSWGKQHTMTAISEIHWRT